MSVLRHYAQIPSQSKYFYSVVPSVGVNPPPTFTLIDREVQAVYFTPQTVPKDFTPNLNINPGAGIINIAVQVATLYKDLGRQFYVMDSTGTVQLALFREAQLVSGVTTEGVDSSDPNNPLVPPSAYNSYWLKIWISSPPVQSGTIFARVG